MAGPIPTTLSREAEAFLRQAGVANPQAMVGDLNSLNNPLTDAAELSRIASDRSSNLAGSALVALHDRGLLNATHAPIVQGLLESQNVKAQQAAILVLSLHPEISAHLTYGALEGQIRTRAARFDGPTERAVGALALAQYGGVAIPALVDLYNASTTDAERAAIMPSILRAGEQPLTTSIPQISAPLQLPPHREGEVGDMIAAINLIQSPNPLNQWLGVQAAAGLPASVQLLVVHGQGRQLASIAEHHHDRETRNLVRALLIENPSAMTINVSGPDRPWIANALPETTREYGGKADVGRELASAMRSAGPLQMPFYLDLARQAGPQNIRRVVGTLQDINTLPDHVASAVIQLAGELAPLVYSVLDQALWDPRQSIREQAVQAVNHAQLDSEGLQHFLKHTIWPQTPVEAHRAGIQIASHYAGVSDSSLTPVLEGIAPQIYRAAITQDEVSVATRILRRAGHSSKNISLVLGEKISQISENQQNESLDMVHTRITLLLGELRELGGEGVAAYKNVHALAVAHPNLTAQIQETCSALNPTRARWGSVGEVGISVGKTLWEIATNKSRNWVPSSLTPDSKTPPPLQAQTEISPASVESFVQSFLSYRDVVPNPEPPTARTRELAAAFLRYASEHPGAETRLAQQSIDAREQVATRLRQVGIEQPTVYAQSVTWYAWDVSKQIYYLSHPAETNNRYRIANPFDDALKRAEIIDRHLGWEVAAASQNGTLGEGFLAQFTASRARLIGGILARSQAGERIPSDELARLGRLVSA